MNITTLPLSYRPNRPFRILFTPFIASSVFQVLECENQIFPLNIRSLRGKSDEINPTQLVNLYQQELNILGIETNKSIFFHDLEVEFVEFITQKIQQRMSLGQYKIVNQSVHYCECGKVELPSHILNELFVGTRSKIIARKNDKFICTLCKSDLIQITEKTFTHEMIPYSGVEVYPEKFTPKVIAVQKELKNRPLFVSRLHRKFANDIKFDEFSIDPDYCWIHFLDYLYQTKNLNDFVVVVGVNQIPQAVMMTNFLNSVNPKIRIKLLITSLIEFDNTALSIPSKTSAQELQFMSGSKDALRVFLAMCSSWTKEKVKIEKRDIELINKSLAMREKLSASEKVHLSLKEFTTCFNRQVVVRILKKIRRREIITGIELKILNSLLI